MITSTLAAVVRQRPWQPIELPEPVPLDAIPTPALLLDLDRLNANIAQMADHLGGHGKGFRPHSKTHKCPLIAQAQLDAGAVGVCAAKVSEAIALTSAGVDRVLVTSPVTTAEKIELVAELIRDGADLTVVVDSLVGVEGLEAVSPIQGKRVRVLLDLDPHMGRTGVRGTEAAVALADRIASGGKLDLCGVQHYAGHVMHVEGFEARRKASLEHWQVALATVEALRDAGHPLEIITGAGTGTYDIDCELDPVTDLQVGSYVFMDQEYLNIGSARGPVNDDFQTSLTVLTTVISQPADGAVTVDCGYKGFASETVAPECLDLPGTRFVFAGDEHGILVLGKGNQQPLLGHKLAFVTPHCDPTVNLYDYYWVHQDGVVRELWPITARGCSW